MAWVFKALQAEDGQIEPEDLAFVGSRVKVTKKRFEELKQRFPWVYLPRHLEEIDAWYSERELTPKDEKIHEWLERENKAVDDIYSTVDIY